jgi:xanthine dehydrogenase YagS FAD-binding subunit
MRPFAYRRVSAEREALAAIRSEGASIIAGGTDLLQLWKLGIVQPDAVIDINALPFAAIEAREGGIAIGALARLADVADHPMIRDHYRAIHEALLAGASPQIRNVATIGGNLMQRTRCVYFRSTLPCNKREPGSGCGAIGGESRLAAIFGTSDHCVATQASDLAAALVALDANLRLRSEAGERMLPLADLYLEPGDHPERETQLREGELITEVEVPATPWARRSCYLKVRDRASFEFAVVSVAAALHLEDGIIRAARLCAGGVGTKPWRLQACERALQGAACGEKALRDAAELAGEGARPLSQNGFKVELLKRTVFRALASLQLASHGEPL